MCKETIINGHKHILYKNEHYDLAESESRSESFYHWLKKRRTVRDISNKTISKKIIENLILSAGTAPSGANKQPWTFCAVSNPQIKTEIREKAEKEEYENYHQRMSNQWLEDLKPMGTNWNKPFLEEAPWLIVVFKKIYEDITLKNQKNYYVNESVGIACGLLITAIHQAGLVTITHTPSPMGFLTKILKRPSNERPYLLLPIGYPKEKAFVPNIKRKYLNDIMSFYE